MMRWILALAAGIVLGLATHVATLLAVPTLVPDPIVARFAALGPVDAFRTFDASSPQPHVPFLDPAFRYRVCTFDLTHGAIRVRAPIGPAYTALTLYGRDGQPFFAINDRSAIGGVLAVAVTGPGIAPPAEPADAQEAVAASPTTQGLALVAAMVSTPSSLGAVETALSGARCGRTAATAG